MVRPVSAKFGVTLGYRQKARFNPRYIHRGIDFGCPTGTPVVATTGGTVVHAGRGGYGSAFGIHVVIKTSQTWHLYGHLSSEAVAVGQKVTAGQFLGRSGATGNVTGEHLHYAEFTEGPAAYMSDRAPRFIDAAGGPAMPTVFDISFWGQAAPRWFGVPWAPRAKGIAAEIIGNETGTEASIHAFTEVYGGDQVKTITDALVGFDRALKPSGGPAGLELFYDASKWTEERPAKAYPSGVQGRWALVVHLRRTTTGQHVAVVLTHGPVQSNSLKAAFGKWLARLVSQIDGPVVVCGDFNRNSKSPRTEIEALGYRTMPVQAAIANEGAAEFPSKGWNLSDIYTIPSQARITGGEIDLTPAKLSDHRRIEARVVIPDPKAPDPEDPVPVPDSMKLQLSKFKRTRPTGEPGKPDEIYPLDDTTGPVTFRAPVDGVTTKGTKYARDELRELDPQAWSSRDGKHHRMMGRCRVTEIPGEKADGYTTGVVFAQIHDAVDDVIILLVDALGRIVFEEGLGKGNGSRKTVLAAGYRLGDEISYLIDAHSGGIDVTVNGKTVNVDKTVDGAYFKAGCYLRGNTSNATGAGAVDYDELETRHA